MSFKERVVELLTYPDVYDENLAYRIDQDAKVHLLHNAAEAFDPTPKTLKIEAVERIFADVHLDAEVIRRQRNHIAPVNVHLFWAQPGSPSFGVHTDPYDVIIAVRHGTKVMEVQGEQHVLDAARPSIYIPAHTPHRAINTHESITLSFGLVDYLESRW